MALCARLLSTALSLAIALPVTSAAFADGSVNLYSSRHYDTDERLYSDFEEQTGITINRIEGNADELIERLKLYRAARRYAGHEGPGADDSPGGHRPSEYGCHRAEG